MVLIGQRVLLEVVQKQPAHNWGGGVGGVCRYQQRCEVYWECYMAKHDATCAHMYCTVANEAVAWLCKMAALGTCNHGSFTSEYTQAVTTLQ